MNNFIRTAISLPKTQYRVLESLRKKMGISRSAIFRKAISSWIHSFEEQKLIEQYVAGYKRHPESPEEMAETEALVKFQAENFEPDEWSSEKR